MTYLVTLRDRSNQTNHKIKILLTLIALTFLIAQIPHTTASKVEMDKTHSPEKMNYHYNEIVQFNITLTVRTQEDCPILSIKNLKILDTLPQGTTFLAGNRSSTPPAVSFTDYLNGTLLWDFGPGPFTSDPQVTIQFNVTINTDAPENVYITNHATAFYEETVSGAPSAPTVTDTIQVIYPIIDINKTCTGPIHEGDGIIYHITLKNTGHQDAINLEVTDFISTDVVYTPGTATTTSGILDETQLPGKLIWKGSLENITGSNTVNLTIPVTDKPSIISSSIMNNASYTKIDGCEKIVKSWDSCVTLVIHPELLLQKSCATTSSIEPANISYTYKVTNTGDTPLYNVTVYDETLSAHILGPSDLAVSEYQIGNNGLLNMSAGTYFNEANATGTDMLGLTVEIHDDATCIIEEEPPEYVGGVIEEAITDETRVTLFALFGVLLSGVLFMVLRKS